MSTKINENYWKGRKIDWIKHYWSPEHSHRKAIIEILRKHPVRSVLEIGCGAGANLYNIKKEFPDIKVAGCDINEDAIREAKGIFKDLVNRNKKVREVRRTYEENPAREEKRAMGELLLSQPQIEEIEFKVGSADAIPFHGDSFDLVLTDACLIYIGPEKMTRVLREIRRVSYNKMMFVEFHSSSFWKRLSLDIMTWLMLIYRRIKGVKTGRYYAYDYGKLLTKYNFKNIRIMKIPKEMWPGEPWETYGHIITAIR